MADQDQKQSEQNQPPEIEPEDVSAMIPAAPATTAAEQNPIARLFEALKAKFERAGHVSHRVLDSPHLEGVLTELHESGVTDPDPLEVEKRVASKAG
ncbi:MAG: hypothetical protein ACRDK7_11090 [Solirubrobacteraceae bacterium]